MVHVRLVQQGHSALPMALPVRHADQAPALLHRVRSVHHATQARMLQQLVPQSVSPAPLEAISQTLALRLVQIVQQARSPGCRQPLNVRSVRLGSSRTQLVPAPSVTGVSLDGTQTKLWLRSAWSVASAPLSMAPQTLGRGAHAQQEHFSMWTVRCLAVDQTRYLNPHAAFHAMNTWFHVLVDAPQTRLTRGQGFMYHQMGRVFTNVHLRRLVWEDLWEDVQSTQKGQVAPRVMLGAAGMATGAERAPPRIGRCFSCCQLEPSLSILSRTVWRMIRLDTRSPQLQSLLCSWAYPLVSSSSSTALQHLRFSGRNRYCLWSNFHAMSRQSWATSAFPALQDGARWCQWLCQHLSHLGLLASFGSQLG
mmetsp:Transcript_48214/g.114654  ORF Transcript_48214/g.114654 Transcript_48214/m.114654 type:complete len:365 (-) Transcript_48214:2472-3566(-)